MLIMILNCMSNKYHLQSLKMFQVGECQVLVQNIVLKTI